MDDMERDLGDEYGWKQVIYKLPRGENTVMWDDY